MSEGVHHVIDGTDVRATDGALILCLCGIAAAIRSVDEDGGDPAVIVEEARELIDEIKARDSRPTEVVG